MGQHFTFHSFLEEIQIYWPRYVVWTTSFLTICLFVILRSIGSSLQFLPFFCQNYVELNNLIHQSLLSERLSCSVRALESVVCKSWNNLSSKRINDNLKNLISTSVDLLRKRFLKQPWEINRTLSLLSDIAEQWACIPKKQFILPSAIDGILVMCMCSSYSLIP